MWCVRMMNVDNENECIDVRCHCLCSHQLSCVAEDGSTFVCHCQFCQMNVDVQSYSGRFVGGGEAGGEGEHHEQCGHEQGGVGGSDCQIGESGGEDEGGNDDGVWHDVPPCGDDDDDNESCGDGDDGGDRDKMDG